jgi:hypothetical protein
MGSYLGQSAVVGRPQARRARGGANAFATSGCGPFGGVSTTAAPRLRRPRLLGREPGTTFGGLLPGRQHRRDRVYGYSTATSGFSFRWAVPEQQPRRPALYRATKHGHLGRQGVGAGSEFETMPGWRFWCTASATSRRHLCGFSTAPARAGPACTARCSQRTGVTYGGRFVSASQRRSA